MSGTNPTTLPVSTSKTLINPTPISSMGNFVGWTGTKITGISTPTKTVTIKTTDIGNRKYTAHIYEPYAEHSADQTTLTFKYGEMPSGAHRMNTGTYSPTWGQISSKFTTVVFDVSFNDARPTSCYQWFSGFDKLTVLNLCNLNTSKVTNMTRMFNGCSNLTTIVVKSSNWSTNIVESSTNMFNGCTNLVGCKGTAYNSSYIDKSYARVDEAPDNPGYLTDAEAYAVFNGTTLTFYYDHQKSSRTARLVGMKNVQQLQQ